MKNESPHIISCQRLCSVYKTMGNLNFFPDQPQKLTPMAFIFWAIATMESIFWPRVNGSHSRCRVAQAENNGKTDGF